jgi:hypothetical protein
MSTPRDGDPADGSEWREPSHLGGDPDRPEATPDPTPETPPAREPWAPAGWDLPDASRSQAPPPPPAPPGGGGLFGPRRPRRPSAVEEVFTYQGDLVGAQGWALQHGWSVSDGTDPEDAVLRELMTSSPVRPGKEARPVNVLRGRAGTLELVAFDIASPWGRTLLPQYAVTAAPMLAAVPTLRLSPARLWKHRTAGLLQIPSGNEAFDLRWQLLAAEDGPQVRRLVGDPGVQGLLLGTDDGDEFWTAAGHVCAIRPDGHRPSLIEHHARLLTAIVGVLATGS